MNTKQLNVHQNQHHCKTQKIFEFNPSSNPTSPIKRHIFRPAVAQMKKPPRRRYLQRTHLSKTLHQSACEATEITQGNSNTAHQVTTNCRATHARDHSDRTAQVCLDRDRGNHRATNVRQEARAIRTNTHTLLHAARAACARLVPKKHNLSNMSATAWSPTPNSDGEIMRSLPALLQLLHQILVHLFCFNNSNFHQRIATTTTIFDPPPPLLPWTPRN